MLPAAAVPAFDGDGSSFPSYEEEVILWSQVANLEPGKKEAALILRIADVARQVCVTSAKGSRLE